MILTLPTVAPATIALPEGYELRCLEGGYLDDVAVEVILYAPIDGTIANNCGATPADALCGLLSVFPEDFRMPPAVAQALDELGHQAVRIVCQRLSGGKMDDEAFATTEEEGVARLRNAA